MTAPDAAEPAFARAVEVLLDRGEGRGPQRWLAGSGLLIGGRSVLTAAHLVADPGQVTVRDLDGVEFRAETRLAGDGASGCDLAIVEIVDDRFATGPRPVRFAQVNRDDPTPVSGCWAVGFPTFAYRDLYSSISMRSQTAQIWGYVLPGSRLRGPGQLELMVTHQPSMSFGPHESAWQGMSGSAVAVEGPDGVRRIIGVVTEHSAAAGASVLAVAPVSLLMGLDEPRWWTYLGSDAMTDMRTAVKGVAHGEPPNLFVDVIARSARVAAVDLQRAAELNDRHATASPGPRDELAAGHELTNRTHLIAAAPAADVPTDRKALEALRASPQISMIVDQLMSRRLIEADSPEVDGLLRGTFVELSAEHGVDSAAATEMFDALVRWVEIAVRGVVSHGPGIRLAWRRSVIYGEAALRQQLDWLATQADRPGSVETFMTSLREHVRVAHSNIALTMLGQNKSLSISDLYVTPNIVVDRWPTAFQRDELSAAGPEPTGVAVEGRGGRGATRTANGPVPLGSSIPLSELTHRRTIVLGNPGVGKSTLATKLAFDGSGPDATGTPLPFVVILRDVIAERAKESLSFVEYLSRSAKNDLQAADASPELFDYLLRGGYLHVIFDGLDEVTDPESYHWTVRAVEGFCLEYKAAWVTVTSRVHGFDRGRFPDFDIYLLSPFDQGQTRTYVERWFALDESLPPTRRATYVEDFMEQSTAAPDLRSVPLMLALMCSIFFIHGDIPSSRSEIYQKCAELYFRDWDARRKIRASEVISRLPPSVIFEAFSALAVAILDKPVLVGSGISEVELQRLLREFFVRKEILQPGEERTVANEFAGFVTGRAWLVDKVGRGSGNVVLYQFTHRTFLEYFAAEHYVQTMGSPLDLAEFVLGALVQDGPVVVAELAVQICARDRPGDVDAVVVWVVDVASRTRLPDRLTAARFLASLLGDVAFTRSTVTAIVTFCVDVAAALGELSLSVWRANSYADHELTGWFEFRSLGQAVRVTVDDAGELVAQIVRSNTTSRAMLADAVRHAVLAIVRRRPREGAYLAAAMFQVLGEGIGGPKVSWSAEPVRFWREVGQEILSQERERIVAVAAGDPSLAAEVFFTSPDVLTLEQFIGWHGLTILFRNPLNPFCESSWSPAEVMTSAVVQASPGPPEKPSEAGRRVLRAVWSRAVAGLDLPADVIPWPSDVMRASGGYTAIDGGQLNPAVLPEEVAAAVFLIMVSEVVTADTRLPHDLGPHLEPFRDYLMRWRTDTKYERVSKLGTLLPAELVAVLARCAEGLSSADIGGKRRPVAPAVPRGVDIDELRDRMESAAHFTPTTSSAAEIADRSQQRVAVLRRLAAAKLPYRAALAVGLEELAAVDPADAVMLHLERLALPEFSPGEAAEAHRELAAALAAGQRPGEALPAFLDSMGAFEVVRPTDLWSQDGDELHYVRAMSALIVAMHHTLGRRNRAALAAHWIDCLSRLLHTRRQNAAIAGLTALADRAREEGLAGLGRRANAALVRSRG